MIAHFDSMVKKWKTLYQASMKNPKDVKHGKKKKLSRRRRRALRAKGKKISFPNVKPVWKPTSTQDLPSKPPSAPVEVPVPEARGAGDGLLDSRTLLCPKGFAVEAIQCHSNGRVEIEQPRRGKVVFSGRQPSSAPRRFQKTESHAPRFIVGK